MNLFCDFVTVFVNVSIKHCHAGMLRPPPWRAADYSNTTMCQSLIPFTRVVLGVVVPTALRATLWKPPAGQPAPEEQATGGRPEGRPPAAGRGTGGEGQARPAPPQPARLGTWRRVSRIAARWLHKFDEMLHRACRAVGLRTDLFLAVVQAGCWHWQLRHSRGKATWICLRGVLPCIPAKSFCSYSTSTPQLPPIRHLGSKRGNE